MKFINIILVLIVLLIASQVSAKYNQPTDVKTASDKRTNYLIKTYGVEEPGKITLDEYKNRDLSREDRRDIRQLQKAGKYKSPEEEFKLMDEDGDGFVSREEMAKYNRTLNEGN